MRSFLLLFMVVVALAQVSQVGPLVVSPNSSQLSCGPLLAGEICVTDPPYYASGSSTTTTTVGSTVAGTSVVVANVASFVPHQGIYIPGAGTLNSVGGTITYVSGGTATGSGTCDATATNGAGVGAVATVSVTAGVISGTLTIAAPGGYAYTSAPTTWTLSLGTATTCSGTIITSGGSLVASPYVGTISAISGNTLTISPATTTTVGNGTLVQHDDTAAIQTAVTALATSGGWIRFPVGVFRVNGPLDSTYKFRIVLPDIPISNVNYSPLSNPHPLIGIRGSVPIVGFLYESAVPSNASVLTSSEAGGSLFGGKSTSATATAVNLVADDLLFVMADNPNQTAMDLSGVNQCDLSRLYFMTNAAQVSQAAATHSNGRGLILPTTNNDSSVYARAIYATGYFVAVQASENASMRDMNIQGNHIGLQLIDTGSAQWSMHIDYSLLQSNAYNIYVASGGGPVPISADNLILSPDGFGPSWHNSVVNVYDPDNLLKGVINYDNRGVAITTTGASNVVLTDVANKPLIWAGGAGQLGVWTATNKVTSVGGLTYTYDTNTQRADIHIGIPNSGVTLGDNSGSFEHLYMGLDPATYDYTNYILTASSNGIDSVLNGHASAEIRLANVGVMRFDSTSNASTGHAMCWKANKVPGFCSTIVAADGTCTCN